MADSATPDGAPTEAPVAESIGQVAAAYEVAMEIHHSETSANLPAPSPVAVPGNMTKDVEMSDRTPDRVPASLPFNFTQTLTTNRSQVSCNSSRRIQQRCKPNASPNRNTLPCQWQRCRLSSNFSTPRSRSYHP